MSQRGRPRKRTTSTSPDASTPKRPRGRPRTLNSPTCFQSKRPRGRPRRSLERDTSPEITLYEARCRAMSAVESWTRRLRSTRQRTVRPPFEVVKWNTVLMESQCPEVVVQLHPLENEIKQETSLHSISDLFASTSCGTAEEREEYPQSPII